MITNRGDLFHIDFGHILGKFKKYMGVQKETAPFVFTSAYAHVLGGTKSKKYEELQEITGKAFNILRKNYYFLMSLFKLVILFFKQRWLMQECQSLVVRTIFNGLKIN